MTYTEIGNYGVNDTDVESERPQVSGFIVRSESRLHSNYRSSESLIQYLKRHNIIALAGIDTRALVRLIRNTGALKGIISTTDLDPQSLIAKAKSSPGLVGRDLVREVIPERAREWNEALYRVELNRSGTPEAAEKTACGLLGLRHEVEHCSTSFRSGQPSHNSSRHCKARRSNETATRWDFSVQRTW